MKKLYVILLALALLVGLNFVVNQINGPALALANTVESAEESAAKPIEPGTYEITIKATHPETGEVFTGSRNVVVQPATAKEEFSFLVGATSTIADAVESIKNTATTSAGTFTVALKEDYIFTKADMSALAGLTGLDSTHMVVFDGSMADGVATATLTLDGSDLILPYHVDGVDNAPKFVFKNLKLNTTANSSQIMARGSDITLDNVTTSGTFKVFGGTDETVQNGITGGGVSGNASLTLINSGPWDTVVGANQGSNATALQGQPTATINVSDTVAVSNLLGFDVLNVNANGTLIVNNVMDNHIDAQVTDGLVSLGEGSTLDLSSASTQAAGAVTTTGARAKIVLKQGTPFLLNSASSAINVSPENSLTLVYPDNMTPKANDKLIYCEVPSLATGENLRSNSHYGVQADKGTGYICLGLAISLHSTQNTTSEYFQTVEDAVNWLSTESSATEDYVLTFRSNEYTLSTADVKAIAGLNKNLKSLKLTSQFSLIGEDYLNIDEEVGQVVIRMVNLPVDGRLSLALEGAVNGNTFTDGITIEDLRLNSVGTLSLFANCHNLTIGNNVEFIGSPVTIYGGAENTDLSASMPNGVNLTLLSGNYANIYGGGKVGGVASTKVVIGGAFQLNGDIYGGGENGDVNGDTSLTISGGQLNDLSKPLVVVAGGKNGNVNGTASLTVSGAVSLGQLDLAGAYNGTVNSAVIQATSGTANPIAPTASIYGGAYGTGEVTNSTTITFGEGKTWQMVTGGNKNNDTRPTTASINLSGASATVKDLTNFTELKLGKDGNSSILTISGLLDSDPGLGKTVDTNRMGILNFSTPYNTLIFSSSQSGAVGNILCDSLGNRIQVYKESSTASTSPFYVSNIDGINASTKIYLTAPHGMAAVDDVMIILGNKATASDTKFMSAVQGMRVVNNSENNQNVLSLTNAPGLVIEQSKVINTVNSFDYIPVGTTSMQTESNTQTFSTSRMRLNAKTQLNSVSEHTEKLYFNITSPDNNNMVEIGGEGYISKQPTVDPVFVNEGLDAYLSSDPADYYGDITVIKKSGDTLEATSIENDFLGQEASPATNSPANAKWVNYYAHFRSMEGVNTTLRLDTQSPMVTSDVTYTQDSDGNYVFTIGLVDPVLPEDSSGIAYSPSGLSHVGWSLDPEANGANSFPMTAADMSDCVEVPVEKQQGTYIYTFTVTADQMAAIQAKATSTITPSVGTFSTRGSAATTSTTSTSSASTPSMLYVYAQDNLGSTRRIDVPVTSSVVSVTIPTRVGVLAVKGGESPKIISPTCYVSNTGSSAVTVQISKVTLPATANTLNFVDKTSGFTNSEINLQIANVDGAFSPTSVSSLISGMKPLTLGTAAAGGGSVSFKFDGLYDPINIMETAEWSMFYLNWNITSS